MNKKIIVNVGNVCIGDGHIVIQSMTNTKTSNVKKTLKQINKLVTAGCELVRISVLDNADAQVISWLVNNSPCGIIADIHFNPDFALKAINGGAAGIRINPGNISIDDFKKIILAALKKDVAIRIGINTGSLPPNIKTNVDILNLMKKYISLCEKLGFKKNVLSIKSTKINQTIELNKLLAKSFNYPIHVGITEAGDKNISTIRSSIVVNELIKHKAIDTLRVSISGNPCVEPIIAKQILNECGIKQNLTKYISCPTCGRCQFKFDYIFNKIMKLINQYPNNQIRVAIMGCIVNGLNEAKNSDLAIVGIKNKGILYFQGKEIGKYRVKKLFIQFKKYYFLLLNK